MKFYLLSLVAAASAHKISLNRSILSKSKVSMTPRALEDEDELDDTVLLDKAMKYVGCSAMTAFNDGEWSVQKQVYNLVCAEDDCVTKACEANSYAEMVTDLSEYVDWYSEYIKEYTESACKNEAYLYEVAEANGEDVTSYEFSTMCDTEEYNPNYVVDEYAEEEEEFKLDNYAECEAVEWPFVSGYNDDGEANEMEVFIGVGCVNNVISIELWTDEFCSNLAQDVTGMDSKTLYAYLQRQENENDNNGDNGDEEEEEEEIESFDYFATTVIDDSCIYCTVADNLEEANDEDNNGNYDEEEREVMEFCQNVYEESVKCEHSGSESNTFLNGITDGCNYIDQMVAITFSDSEGAEVYTANGSSATTISAYFFSATAVGLAFYASYLKKKVDSSTINLGN